MNKIKREIKILIKGIVFLFLFGCSGEVVENEANKQTIHQNLFVAEGTIPLIVIMVDNPESEFSLQGPAVYYDYYSSDFTYNVQDYLEQVSNGRFSVSFKGVYGPVTILNEEVDSISEKIALAIDRINGKDFFIREFDSNHDGEITTDELLVSVVGNNTLYAAATRGVFHTIEDEYGYIKLNMLGAIHGTRANLATITHEIIHLLGGIDIYGSSCNSFRLTLMSCTIVGSSGNHTNHLDPYHKIQLNWIEPRMIDVSESFVRQCHTVSAPIYRNTEPEQSQKPLLIYNENRKIHGENEYFLLEFRNKHVGNFDEYLYDQFLPSPGYGVVIWSVRVDDDGLPFHVPSVSKEDGRDMTIWTYGSRRDAQMRFSPYPDYDLESNLLTPEQKPSEVSRASYMWPAGEVFPIYQDGSKPGFSIEIENFSYDSESVTVCIRKE